MTESSLRIQDSVNIMIFSLCIIIYLMYGASQDVSSSQMCTNSCVGRRNEFDRVDFLCTRLNYHLIAKLLSNLFWKG